MPSFYIVSLKLPTRTLARPEASRVTRTVNYLHLFLRLTSSMGTPEVDVGIRTYWCIVGNHNLSMYVETSRFYVSYKKSCVFRNPFSQPSILINSSSVVKMLLYLC